MSIAKKCVNGVCVCVLPRDENDHRPLVLRHGSLAFMSAVLIMLKIMAVATIALTPTQAELSTITANRIVQLTNNERVKRGKNALTVSSQLTQAAREKGQHMLEEDYFAHISPSGVTPWFWITKTGYSYTIAGENLAIDFSEAEDVVAGWLGSPSHKENMLHDDYTETGVGVVTGEFEGSTSTIVVHMFGKPVGAVESIDDSPPPVSTPAPAAPTESSAPKPTPAPKPVVTPVPAPSAPRIALENGDQVRHELKLRVTGDAQSTAQMIINGQVQNAITIPNSGSTTYTQDISKLADGLLKIKAYAFKGNSTKSSFSEALEVIKHTKGPAVGKDDIVMMLAPGTDRPHLAMRINTNSYNSLTLPDQKPIVAADTDVPWVSVARASADPIHVVFSDNIGNNTKLSLSTTPEFSNDPNTASFREPARFTSMTRNISLAILVSVMILLTFSILIRINIQHPGLIFHSVFVILLAGLMLVL